MLGFCHLNPHRLRSDARITPFGSIRSAGARDRVPYSRDWRVRILDLDMRFRATVENIPIFFREFFVLQAFFYQI